MYNLQGLDKNLIGVELRIVTYVYCYLVRSPWPELGYENIDMYVSLQ